MPEVFGLDNTNWDKKKKIPVFGVNTGKEITTEDIQSGIQQIEDEVITEELISNIKDSRFYISVDQ